MCSEVSPPDGSVLLQYIRNASFIGLSTLTSLTPIDTYLLSMWPPPLEADLRVASVYPSVLPTVFITLEGACM